jgi:hypothetical protein
VAHHRCATTFDAPIAPEASTAPRSLTLPSVSGYACYRPTAEKWSGPKAEKWSRSTPTAEKWSGPKAEKWSRSTPTAEKWSGPKAEKWSRLSAAA